VLPTISLILVGLYFSTCKGNRQRGILEFLGGSGVSKMIDHLLDLNLRGFQRTHGSGKVFLGADVEGLSISMAAIVLLSFLVSDQNSKFKWWLRV
jgi:hypothetical protein